MIRINNLAFSYGSKDVLRNITMDLEPGRIYGLLGENGVGKTTLLTLLSGLKKPKAGTIDIDGTDPFLRRASLLQEIYFLPDEVMAPNQKASSFAASYGCFYPRFDMDRFRTIMSEFDVDAEQKMNTMSSGQLKKTYISFALATSVRYIFLDEPTNGLDIPSKTQLRKALTLHTLEDSTIIISTHQVRDLENIIDPIIILDTQDVLMNASIQQISEKFFFDYGSTLHPESLYSEQLPGGFIQVYPNTTGVESKVNIEALFNAVLKHKELIKNMMKQQ